MKAIKYNGPQNLQLINIEKPVPKRGEVLVRIVYCGICGTDVHAYTHPGIYKSELIPGHESVGIVEEVGEGVTCVSVGDRVAVGPPGDCGQCYSCNTGHPNTCPNAFPETLGIGPGTQGAFAEYILSKHPQNELFLLPEGMKMEQAVLFDLIGVGFHAVRRSALKLGDTAVVFGCGSVGLSVIQSAKLAGARCVIAFDMNPLTFERAKASGADFCFSPSDENMEEAMKLLSHQGGAHVCYEAAGNPAAIAGCVKMCMSNGQIIIIGSDPRPYELVSAAMGPREYEILFSFTYTKEEIHRLFEMITSGHFRTDMFNTVKAPLEAAEKMIIDQAQGNIDVARVLLVPGEEEQI
ncbi:MAG: alcohol dehydrogenase catalytic domain-containing protein [Parasporobacterium sp.]|nr:alcohol dehydrogenase catalytic domain-containing protein [Parasporobacterium sp.]